MTIEIGKEKILKKNCRPGKKRSCLKNEEKADDFASGKQNLVKKIVLVKYLCNNQKQCTILMFNKKYKYNNNINISGDISMKMSKIPILLSFEV